jgi:nitrogenase-stabilizing/protective protein
VSAGTGPEVRGLAACRDAEDWFRELDVAYDPRVLDVGRLHVMKLFGRELAQLDASPGLAGYRAALERAYRTLLAGGPLQHRVFKVLQDRAPGQFVPLSEVRVDDSGGRHEFRRSS